jgi:pimeloyl-ACP methyl ester carboxylesterase
MTDGEMAMRLLNKASSQDVTKRERQTGRMADFLKRIVVGIGRFLAFLFALVLCLPVLLLPMTTAVPAWVWLLLGIGDIMLVILQFRLSPVWRGLAISLGGILLVSVIAIAASQYFAQTPPIVDEQGKPIPGSIATLEKINLNGTEQWISIRGTDVNKPVLLFLAGGPGGSQLVTERRALAGLEDYFVVVNWEQPGAGKSFDAVDRSTLTPERYITDGIALVEYLRERFDENKIYLVGESWGSALGVWMIQRNPEYFQAFIGTGQMVAFLENDLLCYDFAIDLAKERGNAKKLEQLMKQGPPPYYGRGTAMKESAFLMDTFNYMNTDPRIADDGFNTFQDLASSEYGLYDKLNWFRGALETIDAVYPQLWDVDFRQQATQLAVPVYFLLGRYDVNAPPVLAEQYYQLLEAPHKELIWFDRSGHNPWVTESDKFEEVIINQVLPETNQDNQN